MALPRSDQEAVFEGTDILDGEGQLEKLVADSAPRDVKVSLCPAVLLLSPVEDPSGPVSLATAMNYKEAVLFLVSSV